jgi:hypothetical protein
VTSQQLKKKLGVIQLVWMLEELALGRSVLLKNSKSRTQLIVMEEQPDRRYVISGPGPHKMSYLGTSFRLELMN